MADSLPIPAADELLDAPPRPVRFVLTLEAPPDERPAAVRLRQLLKLARRELRLHCIEAREVTN